MRFTLPLNALPVALAALLLACSGKPPGGNDTNDLPLDTAVDYGVSPLVPEEFQ